MSQLIRYARFFLFFSFVSTQVYAAEIESFSPLGEVKNIRQVVARFTQKMVALGNPTDVNPFDIDCPVAGRGRWADQRNWIYDFDHDLPAGIRCSFTLKKGLNSVSGKSIKDGEEFAFSTGGPAIVQSEPREGDWAVDENQVFILGLDAPADPESVRQHAVCLADGIQEQIPVRLITGSERKAILDQRKYFMTSYYQAVFKRGPDAGRRVFLAVDEKGSDREKFLKLQDGNNSPIVVLQCRHTLPSGKNIVLLWGKGISSLSGMATGTDQKLAFRTRQDFTAEFSCDRVNKYAGCIPVLPVRLAFSAPIKLKDAEQIQFVSGNGKIFRPIIAAQDKNDGFVQSLNFPAPLPEKTAFRVEIPAGLRDDAGRGLANSTTFPLSVRTDEYPPIAKFAARFGILELNASRSAPPLLPVTLRSVEHSLAASIAMSAQDDSTVNSIGGQVLRADSDMDAIVWLRRLEQIDEFKVHFDKESKASIVDHGPGMDSIFGKNDRHASFNLEKPLKSKVFEVVGIPLKAPGFYTVELESPRLGASLLDGKHPYYVHAAALVTNLSVHFKQGRESSLVWVTSLDKGMPVPNATVAVRDCSGKTYFNGNTDEHGIVHIEKALPALDLLPSCLNNYDKQYFVTAREGKDFSFVLSDWNEGITLWRFNAFQNQWEGHNVIHAVMGRTLLRAGEMLHMKLFLLRQTRSGFATTDLPLPPSIDIVHQGSDEHYRLPVKWDAQGIAVLDWQIPQDARQGRYAIQIRTAKYGFKEAGAFRVESFRVPLMKAIVQGPDKPLINADHASVAMQVNYLSGGGAANLPVKLRGLLQPKSTSFPDYQDYQFANGTIRPGPENTGSESWYSGDYRLDEPEGEDPMPEANNPEHGHLLSTQNIRLDGSGAGHANFAGLPKLDGPRDILAELEYRDPNGEILTSASHISLWSSGVLVGIKPDGWLAHADKLKFHVVVLDLHGKPVRHTRVQAVALQRERYSHRRRMLGGFYSYETLSNIKMLGDLCEGQTDENGQLVCEVKSPASGNLILQVSAADAEGNVSSANTEVWVAGDKDGLFDATDNDRIDLLPEKKRFEPGETARFQLRMPFAKATALVTVEREGVIDSFVVPVTRKHSVIEVPIKRNYAPNVFVSALVVRGRVSGSKPTGMVDLAKPSFKMGLAEIQVGWAAHELKVKVEADKAVYKIREKAKVSIDVRRADGSMPPPGSEIALAAVDEGLLELRPNDSWRLLDAMMTRRGIEVSTSTAQMQVIGKRHFGRKALPAGGGGGRKSVRELFDTLLFWQGRIKLNEQGHADVVVPLNDALTSFRIVAVASGGMNYFGTGATSVQSTQDLMLLSGLPAVVREQDRFHAGFTVRNAAGRAIEAMVVGSLNDRSLDPISVDLAAGESKEVGWDISVPTGSSALKWDVGVSRRGGGEDGDYLKIKQRVISAVPIATLQASTLQLENAASIGIKFPEGAVPNRGGVKVSFRKSLNEGLTGVQEFMSRYPYTCFEQNASKAVALQDQKGWSALMKSLPSYLDHDGLVKYFPVMIEGDDTLTAYLLSIADEAGYKLPVEELGKMKDGLIRFVEGRLVRDSALHTVDLSIRKLAAISALSRYGDVQQSWFDSIAIEPNLWPTSAVLDFVSILKRAPNVALQAVYQQQAQQILRSRLNFQGSTIGFSTERSDALWWLMVDSDVNANRMLLAALDMNDWQSDISKLVRGALGRQQGGHWRTTVANAWGVVAMKKYAEKFESTPVTGSSAAVLAGQRLDVDWANDVKGAQKLLDWPKAPATLNLSVNGTGRPWVTVQSMAAVPLKQPIFTGYRITRKVFPVSQRAGKTWHKGDVVRIHLDIEAQSDMTWVVVSDPIASGATILGTGLGGDSKIFTRDEKKRGWVWPAFEERTSDSFHAYYRFVPKGSLSVEYTVRLNNDGNFRLPPTRVEAMYAPEMFGVLPNDNFVVRP